jgi:hypothetical protein
MKISYIKVKKRNHLNPEPAHILALMNIHFQIEEMA